MQELVLQPAEAEMVQQLPAPAALPPAAELVQERAEVPVERPAEVQELPVEPSDDRKGSSDA